MENLFVSINDNLDVMDYLKSIGFSEKEESILDPDSAEIYMVLISKEKKEFTYIDNLYSCELLKDNKTTIQLTNLNIIKSWQN